MCAFTARARTWRDDGDPNATFRKFSTQPVEVAYHRRLTRSVRRAAGLSEEALYAGDYHNMAAAKRAGAWNKIGVESWLQESSAQCVYPAHLPRSTIAGMSSRESDTAPSKLVRMSCV